MNQSRINPIKKKLSILYYKPGINISSKLENKNESRNVYMYASLAVLDTDIIKNLFHELRHLTASSP